MPRKINPEKIRELERIQLYGAKKSYSVNKKALKYGIGKKSLGLFSNEPKELAAQNAVRYEMYKLGRNPQNIDDVSDFIKEKRKNLRDINGTVGLNRLF